MTRLPTPIRAAMLLVAFLAISAGALANERAKTADSRIEVTWTNPADFSEAGRDPDFGKGRHDPKEWLTELAKSLKRRADSVLPPGETLKVTFTDIQRAGAYEPWRGPQWNDVRVIKDIYAPEIHLTFTLRDADGKVIREGQRTLRDPAFLSRGTLSSTDPLRFEKRMLDDWVRKEFGTARGKS